MDAFSVEGRNRLKELTTLIDKQRIFYEGIETYSIDIYIMFMLSQQYKNAKIEASNEFFSLLHKIFTLFVLIQLV